jgi:hypothetical protein
VALEPDPPRPARVLLPEAMLGYECNRRGCCCRGWAINFKVRDLARLDRGLDEEDRRELQHDIDFDVQLDDEGGKYVIEGFALPGDWGACRFVRPDGACHVHAKYGLTVLPDICVNFPTVTYTDGDASVLVFDAVCPSVLDRLEPGCGSLRLVEHPEPFADGQTDRRARNTRGRPSFCLNGRDLTAEQVRRLTGRMQDALEEADGPVWRRLLDVEHSLAALGEDDPDSFRRVRGGGEAAFREHLRRSADLPTSEDLLRSTGYYRRFTTWLNDVPEGWDEALEAHLEDWEEAQTRWLAPHEEALRPLLLRWAALRYATPHGARLGSLQRVAGAVSHGYALAQRVAAALAAALERPADVPIMKVALGVSEYCLRISGVPAELPAWFGA